MYSHKSNKLLQEGLPQLYADGDTNDKGSDEKNDENEEEEEYSEEVKSMINDFSILSKVGGLDSGGLVGSGSGLTIDIKNSDTTYFQCCGPGL